MSKIKAVIIGLTHAHVNEIALYLYEQPDFELSAISDVQSETEKLPPYRFTVEWNRQNVENNYCSKIYDDYIKMLDEEKPDYAFIMTENHKKPEIVEACGKRGINICIEKPIAISYEEALKIEELIKKYNIEAVVNWPVLWRPYIHRMKNALDLGIIGKPTKLRYINGHTGPFGQGIYQRGVQRTDEESSYNMMTNEERGKVWWHKKEYGGGVLLDIGGYGCLFSYWFIGKDVKSVIAHASELNTPFGNTEDNSVAVIKYPDKMSIIEATWTTPRVLIPSGPMVIGTNGALVCTGGAEDIPDVKAYDMFGREIEIPKFEFEDKFKNMAWHLANHIKTGEEIFEMAKFDTNMEIMKILDATIKASESGENIKL